MKKAIVLLIFVLLGVYNLTAQSPQSFKYQAVVRDEVGNILSNWDIGIRINILKGGQEGDLAYSEIHLVKSNAWGIISIAIGEGRPESGAIDAIDWGGDRFYIKMEMDIDGGQNYKEMGTTQLYAVPYALYAEEAGRLRDSQPVNKADSDTKTTQYQKTKKSSKPGSTRSGTPNTKFPATGDSFMNVLDGKVGIGTTNPSDKLEVNGNIRAKGDMILVDKNGMPKVLKANPDGTLKFESLCDGAITDPRDGKIYRIVKIGTQCWMAENLDHGTRIDVSDPQEDDEDIEKYCYDNDPNLCDEYGGLYQWWEAMDYSANAGSRGICPMGWHIPQDYEMKILEGTVDGTFPVGDPEWNGTGFRGSDAGTNLKAASGWFSGSDTDQFGFSMKPGGRSSSSTSNFDGIELTGYLWTSTIEVTDFSWFRLFLDMQNGVHRETKDAYRGFSIRCIKDFECGDSITHQYDGSKYGTIQIGSQCWISQNLNVGGRIDASLPQDDDGDIEKYCWEDLDANCDLFGGYYLWDEAMNYIPGEGHPGICPLGWHIPTNQEFSILEGEVDNQYNINDAEWDGTGFRGFDAGKNLKSQDGWSSNGNGADTHGFNGLSVGYINSFGTSTAMGMEAYFISSTESDADFKWGRRLNNTEDKTYRSAFNKLPGLSVRCIKSD